MGNKHQSLERLKEELFGRKIVQVYPHNNEVVLDDGRTLYVTPNCGCGWCSNGWAEILLFEGAIVDNVITNVDEVNIGSPKGCYNPCYAMYVYAENKKILTVEYDSGVGNGYYGSGIWFEIRGD